MPDSVQQFTDLCVQLIQEAAAYSSRGEHDAETESNIRKVRIMANALLAALASAPMPPAVVAAMVK